MRIHTTKRGKRFQVMRADFALTAIKDTKTNEIYWYDKSRGGWINYERCDKVSPNLVPILDQKVVEFRQ